METQGAYTSTIETFNAMQSPDIGKLAEALAKAQSCMEAAKKDAKNPFFKSDYATLASCIAAGNPALNKNGLSVTQLPGSSNGEVSVDTLLMHISGQWVRSSISVKPPKTDPQALGSCLTYLRRYSYSAIIGQATADDDDAESAMARTDKPKATQKKAPEDDLSAPLNVKKFEAAIKPLREKMGEDVFKAFMTDHGIEELKELNTRGNGIVFLEKLKKAA